jgi:hypothetical protein
LILGFTVEAVTPMVLSNEDASDVLSVAERGFERLNTTNWMGFKFSLSANDGSSQFAYTTKAKKRTPTVTETALTIFNKVFIYISGY